MTEVIKLSERLTSLQEKESALETQSGFMIVMRGKGDSLTLSVRRRVGTPPNSSVSLTPDEVRHLSNLLAELMPQAKNEKILVGTARAEAPEEISSLDLFIEREYPSLAKRKKRSTTGFTLLAGGKKGIAMASGVIAIAVLFLGASLIASQKGKPAKPQAPAVVSAAPVLDDFARDFVLSMLDFKPGSYRTSQIKAMSMMTKDLAEQYWKETSFPLSKAQLKNIPADQEVRVEAVSTVKVGENYQVDLTGGVVTGTKDGSKSLPMHIRLTVKEDQGKFVILEQKDLSNVEPVSNDSQASGAKPVESGK